MTTQARIECTDIPADAQISRYLPGADFHDCYQLPLPVCLLGRVYMLAVAPVHKRIVPAMLRRWSPA